MSDWIGLAFFVLLIIGVLVGMKTLSKPRKLTPDEFERRASEGAGAVGAGMQALNKLLNPEAAKSGDVVMELKAGRFDKKQTDGDGDEAGDSESEN